MREIKFRAWNGEQMVSPDYIDRDGIVFWKENSIPTRGTQLMQFTGLIDKNGKEIYEGDVVNNNDINWKIDFYDGCFVMREIGKETNKWIIIGEAEHCEVIGDIYSTPSLLEQKQ